MAKEKDPPHYCPNCGWPVVYTDRPLPTMAEERGTRGMIPAILRKMNVMDSFDIKSSNANVLLKHQRSIYTQARRQGIEVASRMYPDRLSIWRIK